MWTEEPSWARMESGSTVGRCQATLTYSNQIRRRGVGLGGVVIPPIYAPNFKKGVSDVLCSLAS